MQQRLSGLYKESAVFPLTRSLSLLFRLRLSGIHTYLNE